jgi:hypothetical protein
MVVMSSMVILAADRLLPNWFADTAQSKGNAYREAVATVLTREDCVQQLEDIAGNGAVDGPNVRQARILLARIRYPAVFSDWGAVVQKWRKDAPMGERPGYLSGMLLQFTKRGPEDKFVDEYVRDVNGKMQFAESGPTNSTVRLRGIRAVRTRVEKYTEAEVQAGIACNAAARQAVLEHFLKFIDEGDAYEQSEIVDLVCRLWGSTSSGGRRRDEPLADDLIEAVYRDETRPLLVRYRAGLSLPETRQQGMPVLMLKIATNAANTSEDLVHRALYYLQSSADAGMLAILKSQTNGPAWRRANFEKASRAIENRLSLPAKDK